MQPTIGFIGTGVMGSMVRIYWRQTIQLLYKQQKADAVVALGATWADSPAAVVAQSQIVLSIVGYPQDVEAIYYGEDGIFSAAQPGQILVDMTTSTPTLAQRIAKTAADKGLQALDAPVSGGDGAQNGRWRLWSVAIKLPMKRHAVWQW